MATLRSDEARFQQQFTIYVWAEIIDFLLIGPYELPPQLSGASYLHKNEIIASIADDIPLATRQTCGLCIM
jgi:hypothetical protein